MSHDSSPHGGFGVPVTPLLPEDPPRIGDYWLDGVIHRRVSGAAYLAHGDGGPHLTRTQVAGDETVALVQLSQGASGDKAARDRFSGLVNRLHIDTVLARGGHEQDEGRLGRRYRAEDDDPVHPDDDVPLAPWVALALTADSTVPRVAEDLLTEVDLSMLQHQGRPAGPDYRLHWSDEGRPGRNRVWPLPWPGRYDRAGWVSILVSWLLMVLIAVAAVLFAIWVFHDEPPQSPQSQTGQQSGPPPPNQSGSPPPSGSGTPTPPPTASPSQGSGSPTPSPSNSGGQTPTPTPSPSASGGGSPTPPSKM